MGLVAYEYLRNKINMIKINFCGIWPTAAFSLFTIFLLWLHTSLRFIPIRPGAAFHTISILAAFSYIFNIAALFVLYLAVHLLIISNEYNFKIKNHDKIQYAQTSKDTWFLG